MLLAPAPPNSHLYRPSLKSRLTAIWLSLALVFLIAMVLVKMGALSPEAHDSGSNLVAIRLSAAAAPTPAHRHAVARAARAGPQERRPQPPHPQSSQPAVPALNLLKLSKEEFAASDISKLPKHLGDAPGDADAGQDSAAAYGPGEGPNGARLYKAEGYREPTHAELATYMPPGNVAGEWAKIACRTVESYHVDDCRELDESPPGSGLARALRRAAWQFLVRPPRIDGRPIIGAWVRIRFDFTRAEHSDHADASRG
jgi:protein TonB